jgi:hypothetical protein
LSAVEPYFTVKESVVNSVLVKVPRYKAADGKFYTRKNVDEVVTISTPAPHLFEADQLPAQAPVSLLWNETKSTVPIVRWDWIMRMLTTTLDGGLYYEFAGIRSEPEGSKRTDFAAFLSDFFRTDEKTIDEANGANRAVTISKVTGKWRRIDLFYGRNIRPESGAPLVCVTRDLADGDDKLAGRHPLRDLLQFQDAAREVIGFKANGMQLYALFNGKGKLQRAAPDNVARDNTVPAPYTNQLQPAIGCIRCHGPTGGYMPIDNYVSKLVRPRKLNIFDDISSDEGVKDTIDKLVGMYSGGNLLKAHRRATDDYKDAVFLATAGSDVETVTKSVADQFAAYNYERVTTQRALAELGFLATEEGAVKALRTILPRVPPDALGIRRESPLLGALKVGIPILRSDWEEEYTDAAIRVKLIREWQAQQTAEAAKAAAEKAAAEAANNDNPN